MASALYLVPRARLQQVGVVEPVSPFAGQGVLNKYISPSLVVPIVLGMMGGAVALYVGWPLIVVAGAAFGTFSFAYLLHVGAGGQYAALPASG